MTFLERLTAPVPHRAARKGLLGAVLLLALSTGTGCGVSYSLTGAEIPRDANTVSVELFDARAPLATPRTAQLITENLRDLLQAQTRLNLAAREADIQYAGEVVGYDVQPVNIQSDETAALNRLTITVNVRYVNTLDTQKNAEMTVSRFADYSSAQDLVSVEEALVQQISDQLSQDIFDRTLGNW